MNFPLNPDALAHLKSLIEVCKLKPETLHKPELKFFKDFLVSFGATIPEVKTMPKPEDAPSEGPQEDSESDPESILEFDMEGCIDPDEISENQIMGDEDKQPTEEETDKADEIRSSALAQLSEGNLEEAIKLFTSAIEINPQCAILYTKRAQAYLKLNKPNACIRDCSRALVLNCDSAAAYKFRGRSYRLLGDWEKAAQDLRQACKIDFDEQSDEWLKEVQPNALKIQQHKNKIERKKLDKEDRERAEKIRIAREAHAKAAESNAEPSAGETGAAKMPQFDDLMQFMTNPEILKEFEDPEVCAAFQDISTNPTNILKYQSNPKIVALFSKIKKMYGGPGGMDGCNPFGASAPKPSGAGMEDDALD